MLATTVQDDLYLFLILPEELTLAGFSLSDAADHPVLFAKQFFEEMSDYTNQNLSADNVNGVYVCNNGSVAVRILTAQLKMTPQIETKTIEALRELLSCEGEEIDDIEDASEKDYYEISVQRLSDLTRLCRLVPLRAPSSLYQLENEYHLVFQKKHAPLALQEFTTPKEQTFLRLAYLSEHGTKLIEHKAWETLSMF